MFSRVVASASVLVCAMLRAGAQQPSPLDSTRVLVSRREVRVLFPAETTHRWGWPKREAVANNAHYAWIVSVDGIDGPRLLELNVWQSDGRARTFASLDDVVAAGRAQLCSPGMFQQCADVGMRAAVERGRVALTLRDTTALMQLFAMRPESVNVYGGRPEGSDRPGNVRVEYLDPQIPAPDSAFRAEVARRRRRYEESVSWINRWIGAENRPVESAVLIETGDSAALSFHEMRCRYDVCGGSMSYVSDSSWTVDDTTIAGLRRPSPKPVGEMSVFSSEGPYLIGRQPGTTTIRLSGLHFPSDTMPSREPVPTSLEREVRVLPSLARIEIVPRPETVRTGETIAFRTRVIDRAGQEITGLPVDWRIETKSYSQIGVQSSPRPVRFDSTGTGKVVVRVGRRVDSLTVVVVRSRRR